MVVLEGRLAAFWEQLGREVYGPLYLGFAGWLKRRIVADAPERVFFLARDGHVIERVWRLLQPGGPPASYLYASRRALRIPAIERLDERTLDFLCGGSSRLTVAQYFERAGLASDDREFVDGDRTRLREAFRARERELLDVAARERELLLAYFRQEGLDGPARVAIVDLGWHGTLQRAMRDVLRLGGSRTEVEGYYLGTFYEARQLAAEQRMAGFLFELGLPERRHWLLRQCVELFELAFVAPHGGVEGFQTHSGRIEALLAPHDLVPDDREKLATLQAGGLAYVRDWLAGGGDPNLPPSRALAPLERLLLRPTLEEARRLGDLHHAEGFGAAIERRPIARPPTLGELVRDPSAFSRSWRRAFWDEGFKTRLLGRNRPLRKLASLGFWLTRMRP